MRRTSDETKLKERRGQGEGANYRPWINASEFSSNGTACKFVDWKHGRTIQLLSQGELHLYCQLRWNDQVIDIREQFPLNLQKTVEIADNLHVRHPKNKHTHMTTDFLVTMADGRYVAYSYKSNRHLVYGNSSESLRTREKLEIEKNYWNSLGINWNLIFPDDIDHVLVRNIINVVPYYDCSHTFDQISMVKHLIAQKKLIVDMHKVIDFRKYI